MLSTYVPTSWKKRAFGMAQKAHSAQEITAMLKQGAEMTAQGKTQSEICRLLEISVMTFHRWRKASNGPPVEAKQRASWRATYPTSDPFLLSEKLMQENQRLRHLLTDLLLGNQMLQEELEVVSRRTNRSQKPAIASLIFQ